MFLLAKLLKALNSDAGPWSLAFGIVLGMMVGLTPLLSLHNLVLLFFVLFFRVNLSTFLLSLGVFSALAYALDPLMMSAGHWILTLASLQDLWNAFYNTGTGRLSQFNNTLMMGSIAVSWGLAIVMLPVCNYAVTEYRKRFMQWIDQFRVVELLKSSRLFQLYQKLGD